jgi:exopolyphosphatase/guanosine-5'-triphosphate,3'-diphosphate pyrophosphatase
LLRFRHNNSNSNNKRNKPTHNIRIMPDRYAVIDLGTNTFHLLIAEANGKGGFREIYRERRFIQLAENGIETIGPAPFQRGLDTLVDFAEHLTAHSVKAVHAFGTAALRTASNGPAFVQTVAEKAGITITLISGNEEARLIHLGVTQAITIQNGRFLIMDIGGGSVEFIIADHQQVYWAQSFPIGVAVLYSAFHKSEPIAVPEIEKLRSFLFEQLQPLQKALNAHPAHLLVGASGTFDVLENILPGVDRKGTFADVPLTGFPTFYQEMLDTPLEKRLTLASIPPARARMLIVALILIQAVIELADIDALRVSAYAMKEGILHEMMN